MIHINVNGQDVVVVTTSSRERYDVPSFGINIDHCFANKYDVCLRCAYLHKGCFTAMYEDTMAILYISHPELLI